MTPRKPTQDLPPDGFRFNPIRPVQVRGTPPCNDNCPSGTRIREWIGLIAQRAKLGLTKEEAYRRAWESLVDVNPFPAVMGRVCPHPCETECNRIAKDGSVAVNELERFIGDYAIGQGWPLVRLSPETRSETVAVVGAGPAGLSFAYQMARRGYRVTVFDRHEKAGGMLRYGIPDYRLPPEVLDAEIRRIADLGVELRLGSSVGSDQTLDELRRDFDMLFVGIGAQVGRRLGVPGEEGGGVWAGTEYLEAVNRGRIVEVGRSVIVVGGGNTAIDAARTARRQGAAVTLLYRRTRAEMPAIAHEIDEALEEGIDIVFLSAPSHVHRDEAGGLAGVRVQRMELGEPDSSGRCRPVPIDGDTFDLPATAVIVAVSQEPDWSSLDGVRHDHGWVQTASDGLVDAKTYAGGDVRGLGTASMAIGHGKAAAETAHARQEGTAYPGNGAKRTRGVRSRVKIDLYEPKPRTEIDRLPVTNRLADPRRAVTETMTEEAFLEEVARCLSCESCFGCRHCIMYCNGGGFIELAEPAPGRYFRMDLSVCEGCGKCIEVCPCGYLAPEP
jgi:NADPH-dependent glutamate synthase beta subunit-like oxidoreductase/Pyruvate/2-oxoacid:ferredoxin oxidoreductase delta subunit